jgi:2-polyprenyl-6-methoxyphenol hydroxylase-like FAD-dependent oxidoreductase
MSSALDVLVVGAGPIGLTMACHLRRLGLSVRLIEKRAGPSVHSKAIGLQYRVSEVLARLGIVDRFIAKGGSPTTVNLYAASRRLLQLRFAAPTGVSGRDAFTPRAILIPQSQTENILIEFLNELGVSVEWQTELVGYTQTPDVVVSQVREGGSVRDIVATWLVSCEGAHSLVRKMSGITFNGKAYPLAFFMADVRLAGALPHNENHVWLHPDGSLAALPLPEPNIWRLFIEVTSYEGRPQLAPTLDDIRRFISERAPNMQATITGDPLWLSDFRINCRMVDRLQDGRVFLAGDAAHIHSPTGGQGITTGMQDAVNLAWKLARVTRGAPASLLQTYDEERLPHAAEVLQETDRTTNLLFAPSPGLRLLRDAIVLPVLRSPWVQRRMFGKFSQLHVNYRNRSLSREVRKFSVIHRIRAGDRAPDVAFRCVQRHTTLFELLRSQRPLVLVGGMTDKEQICDRLRVLDVDAFTVSRKGLDRRDASRGDLTDVHGDFAGLYGLGQDFVCLIRPDGHVGLIVTPGQLTPLAEYLKLICDPSQVDCTLMASDRQH